MMVMHTPGIVLVCVLPGVAAQAKPPDVAAFLRQLGPKLRTAKAPARIDGFAARVVVTVKSEKGEADTDANIEYLRPRYLKTIVKEGGREIVRGSGDGLPWMKESGRAWFLQGKDYARDRKSVYRDLSIAAAMTRYLYPDRTLENLTELQGPTETKLRFSRNISHECRMVSGVAKDGADYPLALAPDHRGPVRVTVWFRMSDSYPLMIELAPLSKDGKPAGAAEQLRFHDHTKYAEFVLPGRVSFFEKREGRLRLLQKVKLMRFEANPKRLKPEGFAKPE